MNYRSTSMKNIFPFSIHCCQITLQVNWNMCWWQRLHLDRHPLRTRRLVVVDEEILIVCHDCPNWTQRPAAQQRWSVACFSVQNIEGKSTQSCACQVNSTNCTWLLTIPKTKYRTIFQINEILKSTLLHKSVQRIYPNCILGCSSVDHHTCIVHHARQINFTRYKQSTDIVKMRRLAYALALELSFLARAVGSLAMSNLAFSFGKSVWTWTVRVTMHATNETWS